MRINLNKGLATLSIKYYAPGSAKYRQIEDEKIEINFLTSVVKSI
ncbi:MAG: hypothetical protein QY315_02305 [Saprospiraceae bacterium]|jgi:hypothetical protein|nr:MAG: hypothetical protein QY315_02305 [Saprospiraceae bacterium]